MSALTENDCGLLLTEDEARVLSDALAYFGHRLRVNAPLRRATQKLESYPSLMVKVGRLIAKLDEAKGGEQ